MGAFFFFFCRGAESIIWLSLGAMEHSPWILRSLRLLGISLYITKGLFCELSLTQQRWILAHVSTFSLMYELDAWMF